jgi:hypothetical protein
MNRTLPPKRPKRIAAVTAALLGAALLTQPGPAAAQTTGTDCAALGDNPIAAGLEAALEAAVTCGFEVRIEDRSTPYTTFAATPDGRLHYTGTAAPSQDHRDLGAADPTLIESAGTLVQANTPWPFTVSHTDTAAPLIQSARTAIDWTGQKPVPTHTGTEAAYDDLVAGLDLTVETGIAVSELAFTIDGPDAWTTLSTGLTFRADRALNKSRNTIGLNSTTGAGAERSGAFTVRDAAGTVTLAVPSITDGVLTLSLPAETLAAAEYPLTLTTAWHYLSNSVTNQASITSASPDLSIVRGNGGLDQPYFEAAGETGDALAGAYCDRLADPECATDHQAVSYWAFWNPGVTGLTPSDAPWLTYPLESAVFQVDAAEGASCVPADVYYGQYGLLPDTTWNLPVNYGSSPIAGECDANTAVYDVTSALKSGWRTNVPFSIPGNDATARFDGDSARLDAYFDLANYRIEADCPSHYTTPTEEPVLAYGQFSADIWRADLIDPGLIWKTLVVSEGQGVKVPWTDAAAVVDGGSTASTISGVSDGHYVEELRVYKADGSPARFLQCTTLIDTAAPAVDVTVAAGTHYVGDQVGIGVVVDDGDWTDVTVTCANYPGCSPRTVSLYEEREADFTVTLNGTSNTTAITVVDRAGHTATEQFDIPATHSRNDFDGDRKQDLFAVRRSDGTLVFYGGKGDGTFKQGVSLGTGWGGKDIAMAGDLTSDGKADLLVRDTKTGTMYTYPGDGYAGFGTPIKVGDGWNAMSLFTSAGDFDRDGSLDMLAVEQGGDTLYFYPGDGRGKFTSRIAVGTGWSDIGSITSIGDHNKDGCDDFLAADARGFGYGLYTGACDGTFREYRWIDRELYSGDSGTGYSQVTGAGDLNGDGYVDLLAINRATGSLTLRTLDYQALALDVYKTVGSGWQGMRLPVAVGDSAYDYGLDHAPDLLARKASTGSLHLYRGNGAGGFRASSVMETGWGGMSLVETAGDLNADGFQDILARKASDGSLWLYPGNGSNVLVDPVRIGTGWNSMSAIVSGHDFNGDGKVDIIAREKSTGYLWLYPGKGNGYVGTRVKIGSGWNAMREITAAGDLDHDGLADLLAIRSSDNCMYFYGGRGNGTLKPGAKMSCNWVGYDMVAAVGDFDNDGHADWIARRKSDGALFLYRGNAAGGYSSRVQIGTGWNSMNIIA